MDRDNLIRNPLFVMRQSHHPAGAAGQEKSRGLTLNQIIVLIAIFAVLAVLIVPKIMSHSSETHRDAARRDVEKIIQALERYRDDNGRYPTQMQGLRALVEKPSTIPLPNKWKSGGYLERLPDDPWGRPYQYLNPGIRGEIDVFSYGAAGSSGSGGDETDIGSWQ